MPLPGETSQAAQQAAPPGQPQVGQLATSMRNVSLEGQGGTSNVFAVPVSTDPPLAVFGRTAHPVQQPPGSTNCNRPVGTNKFYGNMLLEDQTLLVWTHPYSVWLSRDADFTGLSVNHVCSSMKVFGPDTSQDPVQFFFSPNGIKSVVFGAAELTESNISLSLSNIKQLSTDITIGNGTGGSIRSTLVQGMGFVTAVYDCLTPVLSSIVGFQSIERAQSPRNDLAKYKILLFNQVTWTLYVSSPAVQLSIRDPNHIVANCPVSNTVFQIATTDSNVYDMVAGCYITGAHLEGSTSGDTGSLSINYDTAGCSNSNSVPLVFALPHHMDTFDTASMSQTVTPLKLDTTVYGTATGCVTKQLKFKLNIPSNIDFQPYLSFCNTVSYSSSVLSKIKSAAEQEVNGNVEVESDLDSMYSSGKIVAKFAWILYVTYYILKDNNLTMTLLPRLKKSIERFSQNRQKFPLSYDTTWKGLVSTADGSQDFGNSFYNDHHFHYGYHIIAAAITADVDRSITGNDSWLQSVKEWVNDLVRDVATPSDEDVYFPCFRSFDWYGGHSWAKGIYPSGDGKDEESSSEDYNFAYATKLWGRVINDAGIKLRSELMLAVLNSSINHYMLMDNDNKTQPAQFIKNKVSGIMFENKIDHTTYFGNNTEYIHMIHAIPITPISSFIRTPKFVKEEWEEVLEPIANSVNDGWKGIIYLNLALFDPKKSYEFFSSDQFDNRFLDNGQSLTWSLAYSGAFASNS